MEVSLYFYIISLLSLGLGLSQLTAGQSSGRVVSPVDVNSPLVNTLANWAVAELNRRSNSPFLDQLVNVVSGQNETIVGVPLFYVCNLTVTAGETGCSSRSNGLTQTCNLNQQGQFQTCNIVVSVRQTSIYQLDASQCSDVPPPASSAASNDAQQAASAATNAVAKWSSPVPVSPTSPDVLAAANYAVGSLTQNANGVYTMTLKQVINAQQQISTDASRGTLYTMQLLLIISWCLPTDSTQANCPSPLQTMATTCSVVVLDTLETNGKYSLSSYSCQPAGGGLGPSNSTVQPHSLPNNVDNRVPMAVSVSIQSVGSYEEFQDFITKYNKTYSSADEESNRYNIFQTNMQYLAQTRNYDLGGNATYGATQFADLTPEEFASIYLTSVWNLSVNSNLHSATIPTGTPPAEVDWRSRGAVTAVQDQGSCGSGWAFSTVGVIEGQQVIGRKPLVPLSAQELLDCDDVDHGCTGGQPSNAYDEITRLGGLEPASDYEYTGVPGTCQLSARIATAKVTSSVYISNKETDIAAWVWQHGPVSVGMNAKSLQFYTGGIAYPNNLFFDVNDINHGLLIVGYGTQTDTKGGKIPYWLVKNSWATTWGEQGYLKVFRNLGVAGINQLVTSAVIS